MASLSPPRPAPARHGDARSSNYPGPSRCCLLQQHAAARDLCSRTLLTSVTPATRGQRCPAVGRPGRTQPPCGRDRTPRRASRRPWASSPAVAVLAPACRARQHPAHAAAVPAEPLSLALKSVQTEVPSGLAASSAGGSRHRHPEARCRCPLIPSRQPAGLGRQRHRRIRGASAVYQQVARSVTTSE